MKKILTDINTDVVVFIGNKADIVSNGIDVGGLVYANSDGFNIIEVESIDDSIKVQKYKYINGNFVLNSDYTEPVNQNDVAELQAQNAQMLLALVNGGLM